MGEIIGRTQITGVLLAGGLGSRMGGIDKGLAPLAGKPMAAWVLGRLAPQVNEILISANRNLEQWKQLGFPVLNDEISGFVGPLAGLHAGLCVTRHDWVLTVPCDSPFMPLDLAERLSAALNHSQGKIAVARTAKQAQPVFCLCHRNVLVQLEHYLASGGRKVYQWYSGLNAVEVRFDDATAFRNINTDEERIQAEKLFLLSRPLR